MIFYDQHVIDYADYWLTKSEEQLASIEWLADDLFYDRTNYIPMELEDVPGACD